VRTTKQTLRTTAGQTGHAAAVETEIAAQLRSIGTPEFTARLAALRAKISGNP
jgi:enoyl-CoA hydratase